jgi:hypothetical protein
LVPDDVLRLNKITENYLCPPEANVYGIDFTRFNSMLTNSLPGIGYILALLTNS